MDFQDRRTQFVMVGAAVALLAGLLLAWGLTRGPRGQSASPPVSEIGLVIDTNEDAGKLDPAKPLRCFVGGQFVGELTLGECAQRNGVATGALDVGLDAAGVLAAADQAGTVLTPLPPAEDAAAAEQPAAAAAAAACWRYSSGQWKREPTEIPLASCVQTLFAGRCERPGGASYGRWGAQTLRLAPGRVEISSDNQTFRPLAQQAADCSIGPIG